MTQVKLVWRAFLCRPLALLAGPFVLGIAMGEVVPQSLRLMLVTGVLMALSVLTGIWLRWRELVLLGGVCLSFLMGALRHHIAEARSDRHILNRPEAFEKNRARGVVLTEPAYFEPARNSMDDETRIVRESSRGWFLLELEATQDDGRLLPVEGGIRVSFYDRDVTVMPGDRIEFTGMFKPLPVPTNPGQFDYRKFMGRRGIFGSCSLSKSDELIVTHPASPLSPMTWVHRLRMKLKSVADASLNPDSAALINGLVLGYRDHIPDDLNTSLQQTGTAHFLAISGMHLVLIYVLLNALLFFMGVQGKKLSVALIAFLVIYTLLSGLAVSVVRSAVMIVVYLCADFVWRRRDSMSALAASAWVILLADPNQLFEAGFQLSYLAVLGIIHVAPLFHDFLTEDEGRSAEGSWLNRAVSYLHHYFKGGISLSLGAWLLTAPVVLSTFHLVTPVIIIANLVLAPVMTLLLVLGLLLLILGSVSLALAAVPAVLIHGFFSVLVWVSELLAKLPWSYVYVPTAPDWLIPLFFMCVILWVLWYRPRPRRYKLAVLVPILLLLTSPTLFRNPPEQFTLTMLDVGKGQAIVVEHPDGRTMVYDAGSLSYRDVGRSVIAPYLWERYITRIHTLVLSHSDADHINGAETVMKIFRPAQLVVSRYFADDPNGRRLFEKAANQGIEIKTASASEMLSSDVAVLAPPIWKDPSPTPNDTSVALMMHYPSHRFLLTGDLEQPTIRDWLNQNIPVQADVLQLPHHGKMMGDYDRLAEAVLARFGLASAPRGYYSEKVVQKYRDLGSRVLITGIHGAIIVRSDGRDVTVEPFIKE